MLADVLRAIQRRGGLAKAARHLFKAFRREGYSGVRRRFANAVREEAAADRAVCPVLVGEPRPMREISLNDAAAPTSEPSPGLLLVGHPYHVLGTSEVLRGTALALDAAGIPFHIRAVFGDYGKDQLAKHRTFRFADRISDTARHPINVFFLNANQMHEAVASFGEEFFRSHYNIGVWFWELALFPDAWRGALDYVDELWVASRFIQESLSRVTDKPVYRIPITVQPLTEPQMSRMDFGLPPEKFVFLFFFDFRSFAARKNPLAAIDAFDLAFPPDGDADVLLVIKTNGLESAGAAHAELTSRLRNAPHRYRIIDRVMDDVEVHELLRLTDCFVSLHRSEGFGMGIAEAMFFGKPVIVTGYSGNLDFTNDLNAALVDFRLVPVAHGDYPYSDGQKWAEPDVKMAARLMRRCAREPDYASRIGRTASSYIREKYSASSVGERWRERSGRLFTGVRRDSRRK